MIPFKKSISSLLLLIFLSFSTNAQWQLSLDSCYSWSMAEKDTGALAGTSNGIYFSDNSGTTWTLKNCPASYVRSIVVSDSAIYFTSDFDGVFKSLDNGTTWTSINTGISNPAQAWSLIQNDSLLILGTSGSFAGDTASIYISSNDGVNWKKVFSLGTHDVFYSFAISENEVFVGVLPSGLYYSNDKGVTWSLRNLSIGAKHIALSGGNLLCGVTGGTGGTYLSNDGGFTWLNVLPIQHGYCFATYNNLTFTGNTGGFYYSTDSGSTWIMDNNGLPFNTSVISVCVVDSFLYIGTTSAEIYKRRIEDINTGVTEIESSELCIFPNPVTNILTLQTNSTEPFQIIIYNVSGEILFDENIYKHKTIDISDYSNGVYFYKAINFKKTIRSGRMIKQ